MHDSTDSEPARQGARWKPLSAIDRRVLGVLLEKAKTTPDAYPMSVNALRVGCNQKSNRDPVMDLAVEDVEESLERLRAVGASAEIIGGGRVARHRHYAYDWLGVDKVEAAVMAELLLRGTQTEGELRGRAARMEPITDLAALRPVLASLQEKGLVIPLTPAGRGHVLTHALYTPRELERIRSQQGAQASAPPAPTRETRRSTETEKAPSAPVAASTGAAPDYAALAAQVESLSNDVAALAAKFEQNASELRRLREELGAG